MPGVHIPLHDFIRDFGANVAARRRQLGLSQTQLAEMVNIGQDVLSRIESGQTAPKFRRIHDFAEALRCPVAALFLNATDQEREKGRIFSELIHPLPPEWQDCVLQMAEHMVRTVMQTNGAEGPENEPEPEVEPGAEDGPGREEESV